MCDSTETHHIYIAMEQIQKSFWQKKSPWTAAEAAEAEPYRHGAGVRGCCWHIRSKFWKDQEQLTLNHG